MSTPQVSPAELSFKQCAESIRTALQTFTTLRTIPSDGTVSTPLKVALSELVTAAVGFLKFSLEPQLIYGFFLTVRSI
jgi:hypothetical protein